MDNNKVIFEYFVLQNLNRINNLIFVYKYFYHKIKYLYINF